MRFESQSFGLNMISTGGIEVPEVQLEIYSASPLDPLTADRIAAEVATRCDMGSDLRPFYDGFTADDLLAPVLERWRGVRPSSYCSLYEYLVIATMLQNATVRRTVQMMENLFDRFGAHLDFDGRVLSAFWGPEAIQAAEETELRTLKLGYRAKTLKRQAESFGLGELDESVLRRLPTPELKRALLGIYGVGPASVGYLLFGQFRRYEAFDHVPPWEQKIYSRLLFDQDLVEVAVILAEVERRWGQWKMLAAHLLFEDLFWRRQREPIPWLEELIRL